ncbi:ASCH domain-containing protein [Actinobaculum suis]|uniref:ASCH domain-containing protein n=1 Tax=Actinobaculum suis TaxID=1657 RepID=UPI000A7581DD|nr:ASCH domain-containing protein [Actinobaculum suis]
MAWNIFGIPEPWKDAGAANAGAVNAGAANAGAAETNAGAQGSGAQNSAAQGNGAQDGAGVDAGAGQLFDANWVPEPVDADVEAFWTRAITRAKLNPLEVLTGAEDLTTLRPPAFAFGGTEEMADELAQLVVDGKKTVTSSLRETYTAEGEELPQAGELAIVTDGRGVPRALIAITKVEVIPFREVDAEIAHSEGEGDLSLEYWQRVHAEFFAAEAAEVGIEFDPETCHVVVEHFTTLYTDATDKLTSVN